MKLKLSVDYAICVVLYLVQKGEFLLEKFRIDKSYFIGNYIV